MASLAKKTKTRNPLKLITTNSLKSNLMKAMNQTRITSRRITKRRLIKKVLTTSLYFSKLDKVLDHCSILEHKKMKQLINRSWWKSHHLRMKSWVIVLKMINRNLKRKRRNQLHSLKKLTTRPQKAVAIQLMLTIWTKSSIGSISRRNKERIFFFNLKAKLTTWVSTEKSWKE